MTKFEIPGAVRSYLETLLAKQLELCLSAGFQETKLRTFSLEECADIMKVDRTTVLRLAGTGELRGSKVGRAWVFLEEDVWEYLRTEAKRQAAERQKRHEQQDRAAVAAATAADNILAYSEPRRGRPAKPAPDLSGYE